MGQAKPFKPAALVVEDDQSQRELVTVLLEESEMSVIQCENTEDALHVLEEMGTSLSMLFIDVSGPVDGVELATRARRKNPSIHVIITSGSPLTKRLPEGSKFIAKPWTPLDLLREAERSRR